MIDNNFSNKNRFFSVSLFFLSLFSIVLVLFKINLTNSLDNFVSSSTVDLTNTFTYSFAKIISAIGSVYGVLIIVILLTIYLSLLNKHKEINLLYFLVFLDLLIVYSLKHIIGRIRPDNLFLTTLSFPSGHATMGVVLFGFIFFLFYKNNKFISIISLLLFIFMGFSRIIINIHWFTDVLAGYFLGLSILFFGLYLYFKKNIFLEKRKFLIFKN